MSSRFFASKQTDSFLDTKVYIEKDRKNIQTTVYYNQTTDL